MDIGTTTINSYDSIVVDENNLNEDAEVTKLPGDNDAPNHIVLADRTQHMKGIIALYKRWKQAAEGLYSLNSNVGCLEDMVSIEELLRAIDDDNAQYADDDHNRSFNVMLMWSIATERTSRVKIGTYHCQLCGVPCECKDDVDVCSVCDLTGCWGCLTEVPTKEEPVGRLVCEECLFQEYSEKDEKRS